MNKLKFLKQSKVFQFLSEDILKELAQVLSVQQFKKSDFIIHRGEPGRCMYFVTNGKARVRIPHVSDVILGERDFF